MNTTIWRRFLPAAALVMAIALAGCDNSFGVFQGIQTEKAQVGTDIFKNTTVKAFAEDATNYYAAMAKVYYRATAGGTWTLLEVNGSTDYYCSGLVSDPVTGTVYVAVSDSDAGALVGIYSTADSGVTWTSLVEGAIATQTVDSLFWANNTLFVATHLSDQDKYSLYYWNGSAFTSAGVTGLDVPVTGVANDGTQFWAITSDALYGGAAGSLAKDTSIAPNAGKTFCGIFTNSSNTTYVTTSDGLLYTHASGGAWTSVTVKSSAKLGVLMEVTGPASEKRLVIAKHNTGYGYYEYNPTAAEPAYVDGSKGFLSPTSSLYTTTIYNKPVLAFHLSNDGTTLLIGLASQGTDTYGLYSDVFSTTDDAWSGWTAE